MGEPGSTELLPQSRVRPRRHRRGRHPPRRRRADLVRQPPGVGRQRRRPVHHQGRVRRPPQDRELAARRGRPVHPRPTVAGHLTAAQARASSRSSSSSARSISALTLERLIDTKLQAKLATTEGVTATPDEVDAALTTEATTTETRHAWLIEVKPEIDRAPSRRPPPRRQRPRPRPTPRSRTSRAARPGRRSPRPSRPMPRPRRRPATSAGSRPPTPRPIGVAQGPLRRRGQHPDRGHRGRRRHLPDRSGHRDRPERVDTAYTQTLQNDGVDLDKYRAVVAADVIHEKLENKIVADVTRAGPQRQVSEIWIKKPAPIRRPTPSRSATSCTRPRTILGRLGWGHPGQRSVVGAGRGRGPCDLRPAQGRPRPVRLDRPGERTRRAPGAPPAPAASCRTSMPRGRHRRRGVQGGHQARPDRRPAARAGQVGLRVARHPGHVPADRRRSHQRAQGAGRRRRGLRDPRPRQLGGAVGRHGR